MSRACLSPCRLETDTLYSAATPALAKQMRRIETSLSRKFADRVSVFLRICTPEAGYRVLC